MTNGLPQINDSVFQIPGWISPSLNYKKQKGKERHNSCSIDIYMLYHMIYYLISKSI